MRFQYLRFRNAENWRPSRCIGGAERRYAIMEATNRCISNEITSSRRQSNRRLDGINLRCRTPRAELAVPNAPAEFPSTIRRVERDRSSNRPVCGLRRSTEGMGGFTLGAGHRFLRLSDADFRDDTNEVRAGARAGCNCCRNCICCPCSERNSWSRGCRRLLVRSPNGISILTRARRNRGNRRCLHSTEAAWHNRLHHRVRR